MKDINYTILYRITAETHLKLLGRSRVRVGQRCFWQARQLARTLTGSPGDSWRSSGRREMAGRGLG